VDSQRRHLKAAAFTATLHIDRAPPVIVINSATEQATDRAAGLARQDFAAVKQLIRV
jgi:hypothetical protein